MYKRKFLVSLSVKDPRGELSEKAFAVSDSVVDCLQTIQTISSMDADWDCLFAFAGEFFFNDKPAKSIIGDVAYRDNAYSMSITFGLFPEKDRHIRAWMYLTIAVVFIKEEIIAGNNTRLLTLACSIPVTNDPKDDHEDFHNIKTERGRWNFYVCHSEVYDIKLQDVTTKNDHSFVVLSAARMNNLGTKATYFMTKESEKVSSHGSCCRNVPAWKERVTMTMKDDTGREFFCVAFHFPIIPTFDGAIIFQRYENASDYI